MGVHPNSCKSLALKVGWMPLEKWRLKSSRALMFLQSMEFEPLQPLDSSSHTIQCLQTDLAKRPLNTMHLVNTLPNNLQTTWGEQVSKESLMQASAIHIQSSACKIPLFYFFACLMPVHDPGHHAISKNARANSKKAAGRHAVSLHTTHHSSIVVK